MSNRPSKRIDTTHHYIDAETEDLMRTMYMHIQTCAQCNLANLKPGNPACDKGRTISWKWLEFRAKKGDTQAQQIIDQAREAGRHRE